MALSLIRILSLTTSTMEVLFNDDIDTNIGVNNIIISSQFDSIPNPDIISVNVSGDIITLKFGQLFPNVQYKLTFLSTTTQSFKTINGEIISEDGARNSVFISSPGEDQNGIREEMFDIADDIYPVDEDGPIRNILTSSADQLQRASDEISTSRSANYLSVDVTDERHNRGDGPVDKLNHGGAFEILRVSTSVTSSDISSSTSFDLSRVNSFDVDGLTIVNSIVADIPANPISLQSVDVINENVSSSTDELNFFDGMTIRVSNNPVLQVMAVTLIRGVTKIYYDIERFGYILKSNRYDTLSSSTNVNLRDDEIELSSSSITGASGGFEIPRASDTIRISYTYKRLGRNISAKSPQLSSVLNATRELIPAIVNRFVLDNAPIVNSIDEIQSKSGVEFLNTQAYQGNAPFTTTHPAFQREIEYDILRLPITSGEYSVNYNTGDVYVYGIDSENDGTGINPPAASYTYRKIYVPDLDFTFNPDTDELSANSTRSIPGLVAKISFDYEDVFADGTDFRSLSHVESLNERVYNKLSGDFKVESDHFPVTNVFRILNETTGEIYSPVRFNDTTITFTGRKAPDQRDVFRERASFLRVPQEVLLVSDELTNLLSLDIYKINLSNNGITDSQNKFIGANFDTSVLFSKTDLFFREFFYDSSLATQSQNIDRLGQIGDYSIDYINGIIYVAIISGQDTDLGDISYQHQRISTSNINILSVDDIYRSKSSADPNITSYTVGDIESETVNVINLEQVGERFINNNNTRTILVGTYQSGEDGITVSGTNSFVSNGAIFTSSDIGRTLRIGSTNSPPSQDVTITLVISEHEVIVTPNIAATGAGRVWVILDLSSDSSKTITLDNNIVAINNIYNVSQLGTLPFEDIDGYYDNSRDTVSGNTITLGATNPLQVGDAVIINYNFGDVFLDYRYLRDNLIISYEYGNNALDWSISTSIREGDEYFVTYKYGALRDTLLNNFGSLTQIDQLTNFSPNLNRELYRDILSGTLQSFLEGPTIPSIERLVEAFTDVTPNITESAFNNWVLGRDYLHLRGIETNNTHLFDLGKFDNGATLDGADYIDVPALAHIRVNEGTIESWVRPIWKGLSNDSTITFESLQIDGYTDASAVHIGFSGLSPESIPFSLSINDTDISVIGEPGNIDSLTGFFIWFDESTDSWQLRWRESRDEIHDFTGRVTSSGEFFNIVKPVDSDGYEINEITDVITSSIKEIKFDAFIDGYDGSIDPDLYSLDGIAFASGDDHYIFDMGQDPKANRMSVFKDGTGYLNFQVYDNSAISGNSAGFYNLSHDIRDWLAGELHHVAVSWKFNSFDESDEMHLFIDGQEVPNLFKYGGNPKASDSFDFGDIGEETIITSAVRPIVGGSDGISEAGSALFRTSLANLETLGVLVGDTLVLLDSTADGTGSPNLSTPYTVTGVGGQSVTLDRVLTTSLSSLNYSINQVTATITTEVNFQDVSLWSIDSNGTEIELVGVDGSDPDYSVRRGGDHTHVITISDGVGLSDALVVRPLGLLFKRCKERIFVYGGSDNIRVSSAAPVSLADIRITSIILPRTLISTGGGFGLIGTVIGAQLVTLLQSYFPEPCQPSNDTAGRKLDVTLSGDNINFEIPGNQVIISGTTFSGATQESILFTESDTATTTEYWTYIDSVTISIIPIDATQAAGICEIKENKPITITDNNGDYAEVIDFSNGIITLEIFGAGGIPYTLNKCLYEIDYPTLLRIGFDGTPDLFQIGSDINHSNQLHGTIDEFRILDNLSIDTRVGEPLAAGARTITTDFNSTSSFVTNSNTLLLSHFNDNNENSALFYDRFNAGTSTSTSVNTDFGTAALFDNSSPIILSNANSVFNPNEGTMEFWISPLDDTKGDNNNHYYIDMSSSIIETIESATSVTVVTSQRVREVISIHLISDIYETGTNYFTGGTLSSADNKTITLGSPLPAQNVMVKVVYVPLSSQGDRVSVFRDTNGFVNFFMKASGIEHLISVHVNWSRNTWHRVMVMWKTNSSDNQDRLRLFVDGSERGTIRYGTGLLYGTGILYGQAEIRPGVNRFLVDNIDLTDTFSQIQVGTNILGSESARARIDNLRFSEIQRLQGVRVTTNDTLDVNYSANTDSVLPVVDDVFTTKLLDFDDSISLVEFMTTIVNSDRGVFRFNVEVVDSFDKVIGNTQLEELLEELINVIKPAHTEATITFIE